MTAEISRWQQAAETGFGSRGSEGSAFNRDAVAGAGCAVYKALTTNSDKAGFRKRWAATKANKAKLEKSKLESVAHVDETMGNYISMHQLIKDEGLDRALKYAKKCMVLKGNFIKYDSMFEETFFLRLSHGFKDLFTKAWSLKASEYEDIDKTGPNPSLVPTPRQTQPAPTGAASPKKKQTRNRPSEMVPARPTSARGNKKARRNITPAMKARATPLRAPRLQRHPLRRRRPATRMRRRTRR